MNLNEIRRFRPVFWFLARFMAAYVVGNIFYGLFVEHYHPAPDPAVRVVAAHTAVVLRWSGSDCRVKDRISRPVSTLESAGDPVVDVFEGCSGLNVMIVFLAFMAGWARGDEKAWWFIPAGLAVIHFANIARLAGLFAAALRLPEWFYFIHKYLFTGILYVLVFLLWWLWIRISEGGKPRTSHG